MSRPLRIQYSDAWYHVMNRGRRREDIFADHQDYELFLMTLRESVEMWGLRIAAFCLMPNHYHLLVQTPEANLSRIMRHVNGVYTQRYNRRHKTDGQLFRGRYKSILVGGDSYLLELLRYIHRNPLRARIVEHLDEYTWSSHRGYLSSSKAWSWLHKSFLLSMFSRNIRKARRDYIDFVSQVESEEITDLFSRKNLPSLLGEDEFVHWVKERFGHLRTDVEVPAARLLAIDGIVIKNVVCQYYGIKRKDLLISKRGTSNKPRDVSIYLIRRFTGLTLVDIGREFNVTKYSSVSSAIERVKRELSRDGKLRRQVAELEREFSQRQT